MLKLPPAKQLPLALIAILLGSWLNAAKATPGNEIDRIDFGNIVSEGVHNFEPGTAADEMPLQGTGSYSFTYRQAYGNDTETATGSETLTFTMACDPSRQNYLSVKVWGNDTPCDMYLNNNSFQIEQAGGEVVYPNRFFYYTVPIPISETEGVTTVQLTLYFPNLVEGVAASRSIYSAFTHTAPCFVPDSTDVVGSAPTRTGTAALTTLTSGSAIAILQANRQAIYTSGSYYATVLARQVLPGTLESGTIPVPAEVVGLDLFTTLSNWAGAGYTDDQWRDQIATRKAGIGYSGFPEELLGVLTATYLLTPFVGTSGTVSGLDHYHSATALHDVVYAMDGCSFSQGIDGGFPAQADPWIGITTSARGSGEPWPGSVGRQGTWWGGGALEGPNTQTLGWAIIKLLNDPAMPAGSGTASPTNFIDYLGQTYDPDLGVTGTANTFSPWGPMLRAYAYERMLYYHLSYLSGAEGTVTSQQMFNCIDAYTTEVALEKLLAVFPNSTYSNYATQWDAYSRAQQILGLVPTQQTGMSTGTNSYVNYELTPSGLGEAYGALSCGIDGGGYGQYLPWLGPHIAQVAQWDPNATVAVTGSMEAAANRTINAFDHILSPTDNATITSGTLSSDTFTFSEETFITYRSNKDPNEAAWRYNFNPQFDASDPNGGINNPYALRAAYLCTQYGLTPEIPSNQGDNGNQGISLGSGGSLCYLRDLPAYESTIRSLINVSPSALTPLPAEPGQPDFAWADTRAGSVAFMNHGERFYMNANYRSANPFVVNYSVVWNNVVPSNWAAIHYTTSTIERASQIYMPHDSTTVQADGNLSGSSLDSAYVVSYGNYLFVLNNGTNSYSAALPSGYGQAEELISGSNYNLGSTVAVPAGQSAIFWLAASGTMAGGSTAPAVATPAAASTTTVTGTSVNLSALGAVNNGDSAANLTYTWSVTGNLPDQVTFSANGTNAAKNTTATFVTEGTYNFLVVITDTTNGLTTSSGVTVTVTQTLSSAGISPTTVALLNNQTQQFVGTGYDQFGQPMANPQTYTWVLNSGTGALDAVGLYSAPATAGSASVSVWCGAFSATATVTPPVGGFNYTASIGSPALAGTATYSGATYTVSSGGNDIWSASDQFRFVYLPITGNGAITAQVVTETNTSVNSKAGVMFRNTLDANSAFAMALVTPTGTNGVEFNYRSSAGGGPNRNAQTTGVTVPYWVQLTRNGNSFTAFTSPDGVTWTQLGTAQSISMNSTIYVGLAVCSVNVNSLCTATFNSVSVTQPADTIFPFDTDIGVSAPGSYVESPGTLVTMTDQSGDIWNTSDGLHFAYEGIIGNGSITARVVSMTDTNPTCKAGVMIRNSLAGGSVEVNNSMQYSAGVNFQGRTIAGGTSTAFAFVTGTSDVPPYWVRLTRTGNSFMAYAAPDVSGTPGTWTQEGSTQTISAAQGTMLFGLDVSSNNTNALCTAVFDNITVTGTEDTAPTIATAASATTVTGNTTTLSVLGADAGGAGNLTYTWSLLGDPAGAVSYSANGTNAAQTTTASFAAAGIYYFQVTVTDEAGLTVESNIVQVVVGTIPPTNLTATPGVTQVVLGWTPSASATSYNVGRSTVSGVGYATLAADLTGTTYTDSIVTGGTTYYYVVSANSPTGGTGPNSVELQLVTSATTVAGFNSYAGSITLGGGGTLTIDNSTGTYSSAVSRASGLAINGGMGFSTGNEPANFLLVGSASGGTDDSFGLLSLNSGAFFGQIWPDPSSNATITFSTLWRNPGTQLNFGHSTNFPSPGSPGVGAAAIGAGTDNVSVVFTTAPTSLMVGGGGADGTTTVDILPFAFVNNQLATYDSTYGLRPLSSSETTTTLTSGASTTNNVIVSSTTAIINAATTVNALYMATSGSIAGTGALAVTSGAIVADHNSGITSGTLAFGSAEGEINVANSRTLTIKSVITGSGGLTICLEDYNHVTTSLVLGGSNTYTGITTIEGNNPALHVTLTNGSAFQDTTLNYNNYGASLLFGSGTSQVTSATFGGLEGAQNLALVNSGSSGGAVTLTVGGDGDSTAYSGVLSGSGGRIVKTGTGTLTLSGTCTYSGTTSVTSGELIVTGSLASPVSVSAGAVLGGSGSIGGAASIATNGTLAPSGTLTFNGSLTLSGTSTLAVTLGGTPAQIVVKGAYSGPASGVVTINVASVAALGTYSLITGATGISSSSFHLGTVPAGYTYTLSASSGTLSLDISVPPAPTALVATGRNAVVTLSWNASTGATSYNVLRSVTSGSGYTTVPSGTGLSGTTYSDSTVTNGTTYYYVVSAINLGGTSANSPEASATPSAAIGGDETLPPAMEMSGSGASTNLAFTVLSSVLGHTYQLQYTADLVGGSWTNIGSPQTGTGGDLILDVTINPATSPTGFYRILIQRM